MPSFRSMLGSWDFPIVVFVAETNGCIKQTLLKWAQKSHQLLSIRITQKKLTGLTTKKIWMTHTFYYHQFDCWVLRVYFWPSRFGHSFRRPIINSLWTKLHECFLWQTSMCSSHTVFSKPVPSPAGERNQHLHTIWKQKKAWNISLFV